MSEARGQRSEHTLIDQRCAPVPASPRAPCTHGRRGDCVASVQFAIFNFHFSICNRISPLPPAPCSVPFHDGLWLVVHSGRKDLLVHKPPGGRDSWVRPGSLLGSFWVRPGFILSRFWVAPGLENRQKQAKYSTFKMRKNTSTATAADMHQRRLRFCTDDKPPYPGLFMRLHKPEAQAKDGKGLTLACASGLCHKCDE